MTKRILAVILALVVGLSCLSVVSFASGIGSVNNVKVNKTSDSASTLTVSWDAVEGAASYSVQVWKDKAPFTTTTAGASATSVVVTPNGAGTYTAQVTAIASNGYKLGDGDDLVGYVWQVTSSGSGSINMQVSVGSNITVSWKHKAGYVGYVIEVTTKDGSVTNLFKSASEATGDNSMTKTVDETPSNVTKIVIYPGSSPTSHLPTVLGTWTNTGSSTGGQTGTVTGNGINATINGSYVAVSWNAVPYARYYQVIYRNSTSSNYVSSQYITGTSYQFGYTPGLYYEIRVAAFVNGSWKEFGSAIINGSSSGTIGNTVVATRNSMWDTNVTVRWNGNVGSYYVQCYSNNSLIGTVPTNYPYATVTNLNPYTTYTFVVVNAQTNQQIGSATLAAGAVSSTGTGTGIGTGTGGISVTRSGNTSVVTWPAVSGASGYFVNHRRITSVNSTQSFVTTTQFVTNDYNANESWTVSIQAIVGSSLVTVGTATVTPSGVVQGGTTTGGNVTQGNNCTATSYANYAVLNWNATGTAPYTVIYYLNNDSSQGQVRSGIYTTSVQLPIANSYSYTAYVFATGSNSPIATVSVRAQSAGTGTGSTDYDKTQIVNLTLTPKNGWTTTLSWEKKSSALSYLITYGPLEGSAGEQGLSYTNSFDLPYGSSKAYQAYVYALTSDGRTSLVGYVINVPGTTAEGGSTSGDSAKDYPTSFKATSGNEKVTLSWDAVEDAGKYTIYYRRATSNTWLRAGTTSRVAVNITGLENGIRYEFKVSVNGKDSGVVKIAPSASSSTTVTAPDPEGDDVVISDEIRLTSVTSTSRGTITASWTAVSGATSYEVYVAEGSSSTYKKKGEYTGTTAVISGLTSGQKYKVRILVNPYEGSKASALSNCEYMQVTVK